MTFTFYISSNLVIKQVKYNMMFRIKTLLNTAKREVVKLIKTECNNLSFSINYRL